MHMRAPPRSHICERKPRLDVRDERSVPQNLREEHKSTRSGLYRACYLLFSGLHSGGVARGKPKRQARRPPAAIFRQCYIFCGVHHWLAIARNADSRQQNCLLVYACNLLPCCLRHTAMEWLTSAFYSAGGPQGHGIRKRAHSGGRYAPRVKRH